MPVLHHAGYIQILHRYIRRLGSHYLSDDLVDMIRSDIRYPLMQFLYLPLLFLYILLSRLSSLLIFIFTRETSLLSTQLFFLFLYFFDLLIFLYVFPFDTTANSFSPRSIPIPSLWVSVVWISGISTSTDT